MWCGPCFAAHRVTPRAPSNTWATRRGNSRRVASRVNCRTRGRALEALGDFERARADYEEERLCARDLDDGPGEWQGLIDLGFLWAGRDYQQTRDYFRQAVDLARTLHDPQIEAHSLNRLGNWLANTGLPAEG